MGTGYKPGGKRQSVQLKEKSRKFKLIQEKSMRDRLWLHFY